VIISDGRVKKLEFSEARPRKRKAKIETTAERIATITVTVRPTENRQAFFSLVEI